MSMKPDYFIAHNGLPSILLNQTATRHMIRKVTATSRDNQQNNNMQVPVHHHHHLHRRNCISKSSKDLINTRLRDGDGGVSNKNSSVILSKDSTVTTQKCDNECNRNFQRFTKEVDNKYEYQRKYDNTIFRHDLPDRIVLPPLPI